MIQAIIFDMDGLLIDSEPLWQEAEKKVYKKVGVDLNDADVLETTWLRVDEVTDFWYWKFPWNEQETLTRSEVTAEIIEEVQNLIIEKWEAKAWVLGVLDFFFHKWIPLAIASSSFYSVIHAVVNKLWIEKYFELIYSAEDEKYGKPHPAVYISTCEKLWVSPVKTIAFEDSFNGVLSAKAAKMKCVAVPEEVNKGNKKFVIADTLLDSLEEFEEEQWQELNN